MGALDVGLPKRPSGLPLRVSRLSGTGTFTPAPGSVWRRVVMCGGGGGGGDSPGSNSAGGTGGASGQYLEIWERSTQVAYAVGAGGAAAAQGTIGRLSRLRPPP